MVPACPLSKSSSCTIKRPAPRQICSIRVQTNEKLKREKFRRFCSVLAECPPSFFAANVPMFLLFSFFLPEGIFLWFEDCINEFVCVRVVQFRGKLYTDGQKRRAKRGGRQKGDVTFSSNFPEGKKDAQQFEEVLNVHFVPLAKRYFGWSSFQNVLPYVNIQPDRKVYCSGQGKMKGISESWMCDVCVCVCVLEKQYKMVVTVRKVMTNEGKG